MSSKLYALALMAAVVVFSLVPPAAAQSTGAIQGTVADATGAVVPNASVSVRNEATGEERVVQTDAAGLYSVPSLTLGRYRVEVKSPGMQTVAASGLVIEVSTTVTQNFTLRVASASEIVEITATAPVVQDSTMSVGQVINSRTVQEIPLNGRHFVDLGLLVAGTVTPPQNGFLTAPLRGQGSFAINTAGNREDSVNFMINGINLNDMAQNQITFQPSISTVQEFKLDNQSYSAEYGRNSGAIVNIATRSGTNEWHGEAFEYLRNNDLDARNYFNPTPILQSPFKRNQFGANLGGPVWKDRTFFFFSWESLRQRQGLTINQTVLSDAQRAQAQTIGNPTVVKLLPLIPASNAAGNKFIGSATAPVNIDQFTGNVSHAFSDRDRVNGYYAWQRDRRGEPVLQGNNITGFGDNRHSHRQIFTFNETHVFTPNVVNELRFGFNRINIVFQPNALLNPLDFGINDGITTAIGLPQISLQDIGLNFGGPSGFPQGRGDLTAVLSDSLNWTHGKHNLKLGGEYRRFNGNSFSADNGTFRFANVTSFINGGPSNLFTVTPSSNPARVFVNALGFFAQDTYKLRPYLTLELGVRWEWNGTPTEAEKRFVVFDPATVSLVRVGSAGFADVYKQNARNFQPRVGFVWDVFHNGKTVVRSGYGLLTDQPVANVVGGLSQNPPFTIPLSSTAGLTFANAFTSAAAAGSVSPSTVNHDFKNAYIQSWNFNIQQQLTPSIGMMAGYFGSKGTDLRIARNINQFIPGTTTRVYPTLSASSPILPGAGLGNMNETDSGGNSTYNALWVTATKRFAKGLQFDASYTFSKSLDDNSLNTGTIVVQDSYNIRNSKGLSDFDARHRFVISSIYNLPFHGNRLVEGWEFALITQLQTGNPVNIVTTNATLTGTATIRPDILGPVPVSLTPAGNGNLQYFPSAACTTPQPGCLFLAANHFGNLGRNVIIGPGFEDIDLSLVKSTKIRERLTLQFRVDAFDLFNHPNFGQPNRTVSTAAGNTFGQISNTRFATGDSGSSRQLQLAMKLIF
ncbi:MAG: TonB-dependent receptor [Acidobacteriota bacterium]|nr:TonB-dependent receptor [Acidobacteriota bacterium]